MTSSPWGRCGRNRWSRSASRASARPVCATERKDKNMKTNKQAFRALLALAFVTAFAPGAFAAIPIQHWVQPSGAKIYFVESPTLPMLDVRGDFDAGGRREPADKAGLASVTAGMTSKGVAAHGSEPALAETQLGEAWADLG